MNWPPTHRFEILQWSFMAKLQRDHRSWEDPEHSAPQEENSRVVEEKIGRPEAPKEKGLANTAVARLSFQVRYIWCRFRYLLSKILLLAASRFQHLHKDVATVQMASMHWSLRPVLYSIYSTTLNINKNEHESLQSMYWPGFIILDHEYFISVRFVLFVTRCLLCSSLSLASVQLYVIHRHHWQSACTTHQHKR